MTIFYFTATGNSLAVAKRIGEKAGAKLVSIPQVINQDLTEYSDDIIGVVYPIYGFSTPKLVTRFLEKVRLVADYSFAIGTYGSKAGACAYNVQKRWGFSYSNDILMVDNYLPGFEIGEQIAKIPDKNIETSIQKLISDITAKRRMTAGTSGFWKLATSVIEWGMPKVIKATQAKDYFVDSSCVLCGICAKVCPVKNVEVGTEVQFGDNCEWCLACVHLCPQNAISMKGENSKKRWKNESVSLEEIIKANEQG